MSNTGIPSGDPLINNEFYLKVNSDSQQQNSCGRGIEEFGANFVLLANHEDTA